MVDSMILKVAVPGRIQFKIIRREKKILRRTGEDRLWDIAKACGSTVEAICRLNDITGEPAPERMLLIPVT